MVSSRSTSSWAFQTAPFKLMKHVCTTRTAQETSEIASPNYDADKLSYLNKLIRITLGKVRSGVFIAICNGSY